MFVKISVITPMLLKGVVFLIAVVGPICKGDFLVEGEDKSSIAQNNDNLQAADLKPADSLLRTEQHLIDPDSRGLQDDSLERSNFEQENVSKKQKPVESENERSSAEVVLPEAVDHGSDADNVLIPTTEKPDITNSSMTSTTNITSNETSNTNVTTKLFPKRVKCMQQVGASSPEKADAKGSFYVSENEASTNDASESSLSYVDAGHDNGVVQVINGTIFLNILSERHNPNVTNRSMPGECSLVLFYARWCPFSAMAAPHFNGLARLFPDITLYAVDSSKHQGINTQFGILALPTLIIFHNTKPISKFNQSNYMIGNFSEFVTQITGLEASLAIELTDSDMEGPMPTKATPELDYYLYLAWLFTIVCALGYFAKSSYCERIIESIRNNWREAEIQHEHID